MKTATPTSSFARTAARVLVLPLLAAAAALLPAPRSAQGAAIELATVPMANSTATTVKPNIMFVLDDSGSMAWDYLPDTAATFSGKYGYNSSQCNGVYYNPNITYDPPVAYDGSPLNATATTFAAAYKNGYNTSAGTTNLNSGFTGGSGSGSSGISLTPGPAFYYVYSGTQTTEALKNYFTTSSTFYRECNSSVGSAPGSGVFSLRRLASVATTTITVANAGSGGGTVTITSAGTRTNPAKVSNIKVTISGTTYELISTTTATSRTISTLAGYVISAINACTTTRTGACTIAGFSASLNANGSINITAPSALAAGAAGQSPVVTIANGTATVAAWPALNPTNVSSITVGGTQLLSAAATGSTAASLATDLASKITLNGYSATVASNVVTVTGPAAASNQTPVITIASGTMTLTTLAFPESDPAKLQNFANWYSYYSHRMLMMKTGAGLAFKQVTDSFRVGFATMNNNVSPGFVAVDTFTGTQKQTWYNKLYASNPSNSTPLREILSRVGQYYAHKFGNVDRYTATITVAGSGATSATSVTVGGTELLNDNSVAGATTSAVALAIADQINAPLVTDFGASASGNVVTITGPANALGATPVVTDDGGGMTFTKTAFVKTTTTSTFNGVTPPDPVQYSCQQNFTILSTDGYWNGPNTYDLSNNAVGNVDGLAPRPYNDGGQSGTTVTIIYSNNLYSSTTTGCSGGKKQLKTQPQQGSCAVTVTGAPTGSESCTPSNWANNGAATTSGTCLSSVTLPSPNPSVATVVSRTTTNGVVGGTPNTLADVALYYYQTDLRDNSLGNCTGALGTSVCENNVFQSATDNQTQQHMTTFTLGLGVRGRMVYSPSYLTDTSGDFFDVKLGSTASATKCTWQTAGTVCNWPTPTSGSPETTDDLWHAAVNGRGAYFSATDPDTLASGLANALVSIKSKVGAAAAAATSTLNPVAGNNQAFVASYTTLTWTGNLEARGINTDTGAVTENALWCVENVAAATCASPGVITSDTSGDTTAYFCSTPNSTVCAGGTLSGTNCLVPIATACTGTMNSLVTNTSDTRTIKTANSSGTALINFDTSYRAANPAYFNATVLANLSQWPAAGDNSADAVNMRTNAPGDNLIKYLRGQKLNEVGRGGGDFYRTRTSVMGDALESQPAFLGAPNFSYGYPGYAEFKTAQASRAGTVYMGTNDGMLHAFAADTGIERWAFVPSMVIPNMWVLADTLYADRHRNFVNGSPITSDICTANCSNPYNASSPSTSPVWKTILVGGLNGGGRGFYALDITNPTSPQLLWEFTTTSGIGKVKDDDMGYSFGEAVITRKNDGTWVVLVTSGYDNGTDSPAKSSGAFVANSPAGSGKGYLYVLDAGTGAIISKITTNVGTASNPSGLAHIAGFNAESGGNKVNYVYGTDLLGNIWRFDINDATTATIGTGKAFQFATLYSDAAGTTPQPIMTPPTLGLIQGKRVVFVGTGKYLETTDLTNTQKQSQYAIKDDDATVTLNNPRNTLVQQFMINNPDGSATRLAAASATATTTGSNAVNFGTDRGWFFDFPDSRERVNIDSKLIEGTLLIPSIVPSATDCSPGGTGWLNFVDYTTGAAVLPAPGIAGVKYDSTIVGLNVLFIDGRPVVEVVTSTEPTPSINPNVNFKATAAGFAGKRVQWRELIP